MVRVNAYSSANLHIPFSVSESTVFHYSSSQVIKCVEIDFYDIFEWYFPVAQWETLERRLQSPSASPPDMAAEHYVKWHNEKRSKNHVGNIFEWFLDSEFDDG